MNRSAAAVVKVVAMAIHRQKTAPQKKAVAGQSAASAASQMVHRLSTQGAQLLGIQVSWINIHGSRIAIWGLTVKIGTG